MYSLIFIFIFFNIKRSRENKVFKIHNLTDEDATLIEPAACAVHGADKLALPVGAEVLILGAGPTGLSSPLHRRGIILTMI